MEASACCEAVAWRLAQLGAPTVASFVVGITMSLPPAACVADTAESNAAQPCEGGRKSGESIQAPWFSQEIQFMSGGD
jgi:hypothetical protein